MSITAKAYQKKIAYYNKTKEDMPEKVEPEIKRYFTKKELVDASIRILSKHAEDEDCIIKVFPNRIVSYDYFKEDLDE